MPQDVAADWASGGLTKQAYDFAQPAIKGGLSSRWVLGETGPMHGVKDALTLDRKLIPLWRKIAAAADEQVGQVQLPAVPAAAADDDADDVLANPWTTTESKPTQTNPWTTTESKPTQTNPFRQ